MIDPKTISARFFASAVENKKKTREQNRPMFDDVEMIELRIPGNTKQIAVQLAHEVANQGQYGQPDVTYAELFSEQYQAFKAGTESISGTPLDELTVLSAARKSELRALGVKTVEALANLNDSNLTRLGHEARAHREQAQA